MRLIDADALIEDVKTLWDYETVDGITATTVLNQTLTDIRNCPTIDAVPVEEIETYRKMWLARADKLRNSREGVAYSAMAYAAKVMLYFRDVSKHLQPPGADAKELKFKKWTLFDNADPEEEKE